MEISGRVLEISEVIDATPTFQKKILIIQTQENDEKYNQEIPIEFCNEKMSELDGVNIGSMVTVGVNIRSNPYTNKKTGAQGYFISFNAWTINIDNQAIPEEMPEAPAYQTEGSQAPPEFDGGGGVDDSSDIPFMKVDSFIC